MQHDSVKSYLDALQSGASYRVDRVLKESPHETTEVVFFFDAQGVEHGPFVMKRMLHHEGYGSAYKRIFKAQQKGLRFLHLPHIYDVYEETVFGEEECAVKAARSGGEEAHSDGEEKRGRTSSSAPQKILVVVMEYVQGRTLYEVVEEQGATQELALTLFPQLCDAVSELHEKFDPPLIHRDIKPSNIMVGDYALTLLDLGIARTFDEQVEEDTHCFGTQSFAPPEQFGFRQTDERSDVYALGMVLYFMLRGVMPRSALVSMGFASIAYEALREVVCRACAFEPSQRYASSRELKQAFLAACESDQAENAGFAQKEALSQSAQCGGAVESSQGVQPGVAAVPLKGTQPRTTKTPPHEVGDSQNKEGEPLSKNRFKVGLAWNVILFLIWALFILTCFSMPFSPTQDFADWPLWALILEWWVCGVLVITAFPWLAIDARSLSVKLPFLKKFNRKWRFLGFLALLLVGGIGMEILEFIVK
jgi:serine/threonine protein kinase